MIKLFDANMYNNFNLDADFKVNIDAHADIDVKATLKSLNLLNVTGDGVSFFKDLGINIESIFHFGVPNPYMFAAQTAFKILFAQNAQTQTVQMFEQINLKLKEISKQIKQVQSSLNELHRKVDAVYRLVNHEFSELNLTIKEQQLDAYHNTLETAGQLFDTNNMLLGNSDIFRIFEAYNFVLKNEVRTEELVKVPAYTSFIVAMEQHFNSGDYLDVVKLSLEQFIERVKILQGSYIDRLPSLKAELDHLLDKGISGRFNEIFNSNNNFLLDEQFNAFKIFWSVDHLDRSYQPGYYRKIIGDRRYRTSEFPDALLNLTEMKTADDPIKKLDDNETLVAEMNEAYYIYELVGMFPDGYDHNKLQTVLNSSRSQVYNMIARDTGFEPSSDRRAAGRTINSKLSSYWTFCAAEWMKISGNFTKYHDYCSEKLGREYKECRRDMLQCLQSVPAIEAVNRMLKLQMTQFP